MTMRIAPFARLALAALAACRAIAPEPIRSPIGAPLETTAEAPPGAIDFAREGFESVGLRERVRVYQRPAGDVVAIGGEGRFPVPPQQVLAALLDYPRHVGVVSHVAEARVLERGEDSLLVYQRLSLPIVSDRDVTLRVTWGSRDAAAHWIRYRAVAAGPPPPADVVRVTRDEGGWYLVAVDGGRATLARYESNMDLGGSLPSWMSRSGAVDELPGLFSGVCKLLALESGCPQ